MRRLVEEEERWGGQVDQRDKERGDRVNIQNILFYVSKHEINRNPIEIISNLSNRRLFSKRTKT